MPLYEFLCEDCKEIFEIICKFSDNSRKQCPICKNINVKRLTSKPSFHLKGGGWFKDGYNQKNESKGETKSKKINKDVAVKNNKKLKNEIKDTKADKQNSKQINEQSQNK